MEEQDENMTVVIVDPVKVEVKVEVNDYNPWYVENASAFLKYCCPECEYKNGTLKSFEDHAFQNHENARILFPYEKHKKGEYKAETEFSGNLPSGSVWLDMPSPVSPTQPPRKVPKKLKKVLNNIEQVMNCEICSVKMKNETSFKSYILETHMDE